MTVDDEKVDAHAGSGGAEKADGRRRHEPIAVVGAACRLPGAADSEAFWDLLRDGVDAVGEPPAHRGDIGGEGPAGYLDRIDLFDPEFFRISPREAASVDPQQRLLLELAWEALEDAGTLPAALRDTGTAVFAAAIWDDYAELTHARGEDALTHHSFAGTRRAMLANRVSYALGLTGPSLTVDTGQSSSLVAVHLACEALRNGEASTAVVGGVNLIIAPESTATSQRLGALSPSGRCYTFDARADGYVRGEGGAVLVLKPLHRALADGDRVYGVIRGSAVNNDGGGDSLGAPRRETQERVIRLAHRRAGTALADVQYVELHGTGTPTGDPVEAAALGAVIGAGRKAGDPLRVGSVKTNIGHLEGAAGIVGLLKVVLSLARHELPPSLNYVSPQPDVPLDDLNLRVQTEAGDWPAPERALLAGVSSFGLGGTNCHVVVAEHTEPAPAPAPVHSGSALPWVLSGHTPRALRDQAARLLRHLEDRPHLTPQDVGFSLATTRTAFPHRAALIGQDRERLLRAAEVLSQGEPAPDIVRGAVRRGSRPVLVFPGQGAQWSGMALELAAEFPVFAEAIDACADALRPVVDWDLRAELAGDMDRVEILQPASWAVMVSLARLWQSFGVEPAAVVGHSQGEIAAAVVCGALSLEDGARVVALRAALIGARLAGRGGMVSVGLSVDDATTRIEAWGDRLSVAAVNGPATTVVSGEPDALTELLAACESDGVRARRVAVDYASHSAQVEAIEEELFAAVGDIAPVASAIPFHSTVTGEPAEGTGLDAGYWYRNLRRTVRLEPVVRALLESGHTAFLEMSPHPMLCDSLLETAEAYGTEVTAVGSMRRDDGGRARFLAGVAQAWADGVAVDWRPAFEGTDPHRVQLPGYAFQRTGHWLPSGGAAGAQEAAEPSGATAADTAYPGLTGRNADEQRVLLLDLVRRHTAAVLGHADPRRVADELPFKDAGFDSHMSVELRNSLNTATGLSLPSAVLFSYPTPGALAEGLRRELLGRATAAGPGPAEERPRTTAPSTAPAPSTQDDPIAIVGMACRFPGGVESPEDLWKLVVEGNDAIGAFPTDRGWDLDALYDPDPERSDTTYVRSSGFLKDAAAFDAGFFGISPREAVTMDPQQRLLLETTWEAIERAGIDPADLKGTETGVFAGAIAMEYGSRMDQAPADVAGQLFTGSTTSVVSGRVAYTLGLRGPAMTVDTACSSSLVSLHLAAHALRQGECSLALAGGVTVISGPGVILEFSRQRALSADGRCKAFSSTADGFGPGEGVGMLVMERLSDARRNGHRVLAVLRGSAVNQDGASNGLTAPSGPAQEHVIRKALAAAELGTDDVDVVEAHGTGTVLGDPIEAHAILATYGRDRHPDTPLHLGSLKSNIAHAQAAAGVGGVIKMVMAMREGLLPKTLHVDEPSPEIDWSSGGVSLLTEARRWPDRGRPRRAAVSSFGISGTNAHVIVEEAEAAPRVAPSPETGLPVAWPLSARSPEALAGQARRLLDFAGAHPALGTADIGWSLASTRAAMEHRAVVVGRGRDELLSGVAALAEPTAEQPASVVTGRAAPSGLGPVFVFPGQGAQWQGMARELAQRSKVFADSLKECAKALEPYVDWSLEEELRTPMERVDIVQPALWAVMVSLARLWRSFGVEPSAVVGHSQGELAAAVVCGALPLPDAARVVALRSRLIAERLAGHGGMVSVALSVDDTRKRITGFDGRISVAAVNGPSATVVSGEPGALEELIAACEREDVRARRIPVDYASHSAQVEAIEGELLAAVADIAPVASAIPFHSTVTGEVAEGTGLDAGYWYRNLRQTVQLEPVVQDLLRSGRTAFLEMSPHPVLTMSVQDTAEAVDIDAVTVGSLRRDDGGAERFLASVGEAWSRGVRVDWSAAFDDPRVVDLPTYAFQHQRYWLESRSAAARTDGHPLATSVTPLADADGALLTATLSRHTVPWLADHAVAGTVLLPGTAFVELALRAGEAIGCGRLEELTLQAPLQLPENAVVHLQVTVREPEGDLTDGTDGRQGARRPVAVYSRPDDAAEDAPWTCHATGLITGEPDATDDDFGLLTWPPRDAEAIDVSDLYPRLAGQGYEYGPFFTGLTAAWKRGEEVFAEVSLPPEHDTEAQRYGIHPALFDAALHGALLTRADGRTGEPALPFVWSGVDLYAQGASSARVRLTPTGTDSVHVRLADGAGSPVARVESLVLREMPAGHLTGGGTGGPDGVFRTDWVPAGTGAAEPTTGDARQVLDAATWDLSALPDPVPGTVLVPAEGYSDEPLEAINRALRLVREWLAEERFEDARLVFALGDTLAHAAVAGFVRTAGTEHPGRFGLLFDDVAHTAGDPLPEATAAALASGEPEVRVRGGEVAVRRLARAGTRRLLSMPGDDSDWRVGVTRKGSLETLAAVPAPLASAPLADGEVRVRVHAAGLNFRDLVVALDMVQGLDGIGAEGAGTVIETGPGVTALSVGDRVMGLLPNAMAPVTVGDARPLVRVPEGWTFEQAASVPAVFLTAWMGMADLAGLKAGERVLIHAATGGLGQAAMQVAEYLGAEVFATASPAKQHLLREMGLDGDHIASTRTLDFRERFLAATGGAGMDVVVNSLAGEFTDASLDLLPGGGRFVEMGKTDVRDPETVAADHPGVVYQYFDLLAEDPDDVNTALHQVTGLLTDGTLTPPLVNSWPIGQAPEAFDLMRRAGHLGKIVLTVPQGWDTGRTVLITGGTGTLGGLLARHLVTHRGVRHLLLTSRRGLAAEGAAELVADLADLGARAEVAACDVGDREALRELLANIPDDRPLGAVIHAAGLLDDSVVEALTEEQVARVLHAKTAAATHLDELTAHLDLDALVFFSSVAGVLGTAGQANYAAANAYLDALARDRRGRGLPAVSMAWGLWEQASGMTGHLDRKNLGRLARTGVAAMSSDEGLALFDAALDIGDPALVTALLDMPVLREQAAGDDLHEVFRGLVGAPKRRPAQAAAAATTTRDGGSSLKRRLADAPREERESVLLDLVRSHAVTVLRLGSAQELGPDRAFREAGFDSLTAVELRNRLNAATGLRLPSTVTFRHPTPAQLAERLHSELFSDEAAGPPSSVMEDLARLRTALGGIGADDERRAAVADQLGALLSEFTGAEGTGGQEAQDGELMSATDDEMFALINKELGIE